ncbi:unnamed protein product, partial [Didymodactylos carnosus]
DTRTEEEKTEPTETFCVRTLDVKSHTVCDLTLPYNDIDDVRAHIDQVASNLTRINTIEEANYFKQNADLLQNHKTSFTDSALIPPITELKDFYMTDPISRASLTMAKCVKAVEEQLKSRHT